MPPMVTTPKTLALVRLSALGDVVMWVPVIRSLQAYFPDLKITWITSKAAYRILEGLSGVEFIVIDKPKTVVDYWRFYKILRRRRFDVLFAGQASLRCNFLYPLIRAKQKIGFDKQRARDLHHFFITKSIPFKKEHLMESFFAFAKMLGVAQPQWRWDLNLAEDDYAFAAANIPPGENYVVLNAMASKDERNWSIERYVQLLNTLQQQHPIKVILTGGPSKREIALAATIAAQLQHTPINLVGKTTPKQLAAVLAKARCLIAPDTGPVHLATAMGTPVVGLYAVAPAQLSGPYFSQATTVDVYAQAVREILQQEPQTLPWVTRVHDAKAMQLITVAAVLAKINEVLS